MDRSTLPELPPLSLLQPGIRFAEVILPGNGSARRLWVYMPEKPAKKKLPCILIAPAGTRLFHGIDLGEGDRKEHLPYVRAGFIVVAYELSGPLDENSGDREAIAAAKEFYAAEAGVNNAKTALEYALAKIPEVDPGHILAVGHSSAATLALTVAAKEPRIAGCVAYMPEPDAVKHLESILPTLDREIPGFRALIERTSPKQNIAQIKCPVFLYTAQDDEVVPFGDVQDFSNALMQAGKPVQFGFASAGGHFDAMINAAIPEGVKWLKRQADTPTAHPSR